MTPSPKGAQRARAFPLPPAAAAQSQVASVPGAGVDARPNLVSGQCFLLIAPQHLCAAETRCTGFGEPTGATGVRRRGVRPSPAANLVVATRRGRPADILSDEPAVDNPCSGRSVRKSRAKRLFRHHRSGTIQRGAVAAVPKAGGLTSVLATGPTDPSAIAVDESGVYFASLESSGKIERIPKGP